MPLALRHPIHHEDEDSISDIWTLWGVLLHFLSDHITSLTSIFENAVSTFVLLPTWSTLL